MLPRMKNGVEKMEQLGWREWGALPQLGIPALKIKVDSGARTSCLHAERIEEFERDGEAWVRFWVLPVASAMVQPRQCEARVTDRRMVCDSGGNRAMRVFIHTQLEVGGSTWNIEMTLNNRKNMKFRMLLGRTAMNGRFTINPQASYLLGRAPEELASLYPELEQTAL